MPPVPTTSGSEDLFEMITGHPEAMAFLRAIPLEQAAKEDPRIPAGAGN